jgi:hypothetical protein
LSLSVTLLHQQPDNDSSQANGSPHDPQVPGLFMTGPKDPQPIDTFMRTPDHENAKELILRVFVAT